MKSYQILLLVILGMVYGFGVGYKTGQGDTYDQNAEIGKLKQQINVIIEADNDELMNLAEEIRQLELICHPHLRQASQ